MWEQEAVEKLKVEVWAYLIWYKFRNVDDEFGWMFNGVHGPLDAW